MKIKYVKYAFAIMDYENHCWMAQEAAESKYKHDVRKLFQPAKKVTGTKPTILITNGLPAHHDTYKKRVLGTENLGQSTSGTSRF